MTEPFLRFGGEDGPSTVDPTVLTENIGSDPIEATALGLKNLDRVMDYLLTATTQKGDDYDLLEEVYKEVLGHRLRWFAAVAKQVGGVVEQRALGGRGDETFVRIPKEKQKAAVQFLLANAMTTPTKLLNPKIVNHFKYTGVASDIIGQQRMLLTSLLSPVRLGRLFDAEVLNPDKAYTVVELVGDIQDGVFSELKEATPKVDPIRRALQRSYVDLLKKEFDADPAPAGGLNLPIGRPRGLGLDSGRVSELRAVARVALEKLRQDLAKAKAKDPATQAHLADLHEEIVSILNESKKK